jgi:predicted dehydrogenase
MSRKRLIQVGVGGWGLNWLEYSTTSEDFDLVACVDVSRDAFETARDRHGLDPARFYEDLRDALKEHGADAVLLVVPPAVHADIAEIALSAGAHVLVEKPIADTIEDARRMNAAAHAADRLLVVSQNYRYRPAAQTVKWVLDQGVLGEVGYATVDFRKAPSYPSPEGLHTFRGRPGFRGYRLVEDMSIHHFDLMRGLLGSDAVSVYARTLDPSWTWFDAPAAVFAEIELAGGAHVAYSASWVTQGPGTNWNGHWRIDCENGQVEWSDDRVVARSKDIFALMFKRGFREGGEESEAIIQPMAREDRVYLLHELACAIDGGPEPETVGTDNVHTLALSLAVQTSAAENRVVDVRALVEEPVAERSTP